MATRESTITFVLEQLGGLRGVRARKMFGEYALYYQEKVVGLVCDDLVYLKPTVKGVALLEGHFELLPAYPGAKPSLCLNEEVLENRELFGELVDVTAAALPAPKPKKRPKKRDK